MAAQATSGRTKRGANTEDGRIEPPEKEAKGTSAPESKAPSDTSSDGYRDPYDDGYEERHPDDPMAYGDRWKWEQSSNPPKRFTRAATEADVDAALARMKDHTPPPAEPNACRFYPDRMERGRFLVKYYRIVNRWPRICVACGNEFRPASSCWKRCTNCRKTPKRKHQ